MTALLTPTLATLAGDKPGKSVWLGCTVALAGTLMLSLDKAGPVLAPANATRLAIGVHALLAPPCAQRHLAPGGPCPGQGTAFCRSGAPRAGGDACIFLAAFFYSLATVRLSRLVSGVSSLQLATAKSAAFAVIAIAWLAVAAGNQVSCWRRRVALLLDLCMEQA